VKWVGSGSALWRVRVDLSAIDDEQSRVWACAEELCGLVTEADGLDDVGAMSADHGRGIEGRPVVGMLFWVRADDVGKAAVLAVETARVAGGQHGVGPDLYDVTVIPEAAVVRQRGPSYPTMAD
jgi:hypothetical protein